MAIQIEVMSDREFQRILENEIKIRIPGAEVDTTVRKSGVALQLTEIAIAGAGLLISVVSLILTLRRENKKQINLKIKDGKKELNIEGINQDLDINKIIRDFLKK